MPRVWRRLEIAITRGANPLEEAGEEEEGRAARIRGKMDLMRRKWPRWSAANCCSWPSSVRMYVGE